MLHHRSDQSILQKQLLTRSFWALSLALGFVLASGLVACTRSGILADSSVQPGPNVKTKVPVWTQNAGYQFTMVNLSGIDSFVPFASNTVQVLLNPDDSQGNQLIGPSPEVHGMKADGSFFIASDPLSLTVLTLYYHEMTLLRMDEQIGASTNAGTYHVALFTSTVGGYNDNAFYSPQFNTTFVLPYADSQVPMGLNSGILAHEHFHMLFQKLVLNPVAQTNQQSAAARIVSNGTAHTPPPVISHQAPPKRPAPLNPDIELYEDSYLRGLNEGLADFWGWLYTGDDDFVGRSLPEIKETRSLTPAAVFFPSKRCFLLSLKSMNQLSNGIGPVYGLGNLVARWLKDFRLRLIKEDPSLSDNNKFTAHLVNALRSYAVALQGLSATDTIGSEIFPQILVSEMNPQSAETLAWTKSWTTPTDSSVSCSQ